jgi:hypothetical protein
MTVNEKIEMNNTKSAHLIPKIQLAQYLKLVIAIIKSEQTFLMKKEDKYGFKNNIMHCSPVRV